MTSLVICIVIRVLLKLAGEAGAKAEMILPFFPDDIFLSFLSISKFALMRDLNILPEAFSQIFCEISSKIAENFTKHYKPY